jgi:hypothetical protein
MVALASVGIGGAIQAFAIVGDTASDGTGTRRTIATHALTDSPNAAGDYVFLEVSEDDISSGGVEYRYFSPQVTVAGSGTAVMTVIQGDPSVWKAGLTADTVS